MGESDAPPDGNEYSNPYEAPATDSPEILPKHEAVTDKRLAKTAWTMFANWVFVIAFSFPCIGLGLTGQTTLFYVLLIPLAVCAVLALLANIVLLALSLHSCWTLNRGVWYLIASLVVPVTIGVPFIFS